MRAIKYQQLTQAQRDEYNRRRRERYRAAHPVTTNKQRKIIAARSITSEERARLIAEQDMQEEIDKIRNREQAQDMWAQYQPRKRNCREPEQRYNNRMLIVKYREQIAQLTQEREQIMNTTPLTRELISKANQISYKKYTLARKIADLMDNPANARQYILQEYGIRIE